MSRKKQLGIRYGDPRVFFESKTTQPFKSPTGIEYDTGTVVRGSAYIKIDSKDVSVSLPSMAEIIYFQASKLLKKAHSIKNKALKLQYANGTYHITDEEFFYLYMQLCSLGILGLYSSMESMVYELYIRKNNERKVLIDGKEMTFQQFTNLGFDRKITSVAAQLSGKANIYGTELLNRAKEIKQLRTIIQHWDVERRDDYFVNLPDNHPLKIFPEIDPLQILEDTRKILNHYSLNSQSSAQEAE
jgi:hypothetical protein